MPPTALDLAVRRILPAIMDADVPHAVAGGLALSFHGHPRSTHDVDLNLFATEVGPVTDVFVRLGLTELPDGPKDLGLYQLHSWSLDVVEAYVDVRVDLLVGRNPFLDEVARRRIDIDYPGVERPIRCVDVESLIVQKLYSGRMLDLADVRELMTIHKDGVDVDYIRRWVAELNLSDAWSDVNERR